MAIFDQTVIKSYLHEKIDITHTEVTGLSKCHTEIKLFEIQDY